MQHTIEIFLPIFGFLVCGYGAGRFGLISDEGIKGIMTFILYFAIPALLFRIVVSNELPGLDDLSVLLAYFGGGDFIRSIDVDAGGTADGAGSGLVQRVDLQFRRQGI